MADSIYMIFCQQGSAAGRLVLGVHAAAPTAVVQCSVDPSEGAQVWSVHAIPGAVHVFLKHEGSGLYAKFASQQDAQIMLAPLDPQDPSFALQLQPTGRGYVAINNADASMVMDVRGGVPSDGVPVIAWPWHSGANQQWLFGPPTT